MIDIIVFAVISVCAHLFFVGLDRACGVIRLKTKRQILMESGWCRIGRDGKPYDFHQLEKVYG